MVKLKLIVDENIPNSVIDKLRELGYLLYAIREENKGLEDEKIIQLSRDKNQSILTMDKDFGYLTYRLEKKPFGVILLRIHPQSPERIYRMVWDALNKIDTLEIDVQNKFIVFDGLSLRIREIK
ncbi:MAG: DUF5615 family PIN-like protein [Promethearchaeia archaeon]